MVLVGFFCMWDGLHKTKRYGKMKKIMYWGMRYEENERKEGKEKGWFLRF